jgi:hypothetical protein
VQRHLAVGQVDRLATLPCLLLEGAARRYERRHVGDGVPDAKATVAASQTHSLVEIARGGGVNGDERYGGPVVSLRCGSTGGTCVDAGGGGVCLALRRE